MKIKLSATFEGDCMICKQNTVVFSAGDEDTKKVVTLCEECAKKLGNMSTSDVIEQYGRSAEKEAFSDGMQITGIDKLQEKLREKKSTSESK